MQYQAASHNFRARRLLLPLLVLAVGMLWKGPSAQPVSGHLLSGAQVEETTLGRGVLRVQFNCPVRYLLHHPPARGSLLLVEVEAPPPCEPLSRLPLQREGIDAHGDDTEWFSQVTLETATDGRLLLEIRFTGPMEFRVGQGRDIRSIEISMMPVRQDRHR